MQTTITIKEIYRNEGDKNGKHWQSVKLLDTKRQYYITFQPSIIPKGLEKGNRANIEYENGDRAGSYKLTKIIEVFTNPTLSQGSPADNRGAARTVADVKPEHPKTSSEEVSSRTEKPLELEGILKHCKTLAEEAFPQASTDCIAELTATLIDCYKGLLWLEHDMKR